MSSETEANNFQQSPHPTPTPCSVTAHDCPETRQPQTQSLQSVQVSIGIVVDPAAMCPHRDFHQLQRLPCNTMSAELVNFRNGVKKHSWKRKPKLKIEFRLLHTVLTIPFPTVNWESRIMFLCSRLSQPPSGLKTLTF